MAWGQRSRVSPKLLLVVGIHVTGLVGALLTPALNYYKDVLIPMANASVSERLGIALDERGVAWLWAITSAAQPVGLIVGSAISGYLLDRFGRRTTAMLLKNAPTLAASCVLIGSGWVRSFEMLIAARFLCGINSALRRTIGVFVAECTPDKSRGSVALLVSLGTQPWFVLAVILAMPSLLGQPHLWQYYVFIPILPVMFCMACSLYMRESPKYIFEKTHNEQKTTEAIRFYHGDGADVEAVLEHYDHESRYAQGSGGMASLAQIWSSLHLYRAFLICIVTQVAAGASAGYIQDHYSKAILTASGLSAANAMQVTLALTLVRLCLGLITSLTLIEQIGRRKLILTTCGLSILSLICLFLNDFFDQMASEEGVQPTTALRASSVLGIQGFLLHNVADGLGLYYLPRIIVSEVCPTFSRGKTAAVSNVVGDLAGLAVVFIWPPLHQAVGAYSFVPQVGVELFCFIWLFLHMPETKGMPVDKIVATFVGKYSMTQLGSLVKKHTETHQRKSSEGGVVWPCMPYGNVMRLSAETQIDACLCDRCIEYTAAQHRQLPATLVKKLLRLRRGASVDAGDGSWKRSSLSSRFPKLSLGLKCLSTDNPSLAIKYTADLSGGAVEELKVVNVVAEESLGKGETKSRQKEAVEEMLEKACENA